MRAPVRQRHRPREICPAPAGIDLRAVATRVTYAGSVEHKDTPSPAGWPRPRADAAICDRGLATDCFVRVTAWLKKAIMLGNVGAPWEDGLPRYAWHREGDTVYEARLSNRNIGAYKGYPLEPEEQPRGLE